MFLLKDTTQWRQWGSNPQPFGLKSSTLPLSYCARRAVAAYLKVVRRRKPSSAEGTRGGRAREGGLFPLSLGGLGGLPLDFFLFLSASMCVLMCVFHAFGNRFQSRFFARKYISWRVGNQMQDKIVFRQSLFFLIFLQHVSLTLFQALAKYFNHWSLMVLQRVVFSKRYTLASFQLEHPLRMQASSRFLAAQLSLTSFLVDRHNVRSLASLKWSQCLLSNHDG